MHTYFTDEQTAIVGVDEDANVDLAQSTKKNKKKKHRHQDSGRFYMSNSIKVQRKLQPFFTSMHKNALLTAELKNCHTPFRNHPKWQWKLLGSRSTR